MAPLKTSLSRSVGKLLGVQQDTDLSLRGATQSTRVPPPDAIPFRFAMFGGGGSGAGWVGGGGGGGGYVEEEITALVTGVTYTVNIGAAGATPGPAPPGPNADGNAGGNTTFATPEGTFTAYGGGGGGGNNLPGDPGGTGGGSGGTGGSAGAGDGNRVTGTSNSGQTSPPQPRTLSQVLGYPGGGYSGESTGGGGGAGGAGTSGSGSGAGNGGAGITVSNYGPYNGTFGAGGGGSQTGSPPPDHANGGSPFAGHGTNSSNSEKNASGYANGGGGVREAGYAGGSATAGIFLMRTPDAVTITLSSGTQTSGSGYKYVRMTSNGTISFS